MRLHAAATPVEDMAKVAEERAKKGDTAGAAACARAALEPVLEVEVLRGKALYLTGDKAGALTVYERVLDVAPSNAEALFARSAVLYETKGEDLKALQAAHEGFEAFVAAHPDSPRAELAQAAQRVRRGDGEGGRPGEVASKPRAEERRIRLSQPRPWRPAAPMMAAGPMAGAGRWRGGGQDGPPALTQEMVEPIQNTERTPELEAGLAKLVEQGEEHLAKGQLRRGAGRVPARGAVPAGNGRAKAGMAWALVGLGKPMADRVWGVAVGSDAGGGGEAGRHADGQGRREGRQGALGEAAAVRAGLPEQGGPAGQGRPVAERLSRRRPSRLLDPGLLGLHHARGGGHGRRRRRGSGAGPTRCRA